MRSVIRGIEYHLPSKSLTTEDLARQFPEWSLRSIDAKTGIQRRNLASDSECASDLAVLAAEKLFQSGICHREDIDFLLFCTQSPDYVLPTSACLLQERLGIPINAGALDFNLGCSGFVYGLGLAAGLIESGQAESLLLLTADTYSKYLAERDKASRAIFGDGAAATWITGSREGAGSLGPFLYGTDGRGAMNLIVRNSGSRRSTHQVETQQAQRIDESTQQTLFMDGPKLFSFALETVPRAVKALLAKSRLSLEDVDLFVFHQANAYMLEEIRSILGIPRHKFQLTISHCGNTVSSTIPIALKHAELDGRLMSGQRTMVVGFGAGYSWGAAMVHWADRPTLSSRERLSVG